MLLELDNVSKAYGATTVLRKVNFQLDVGETAAIVGPSGCGKSTMLNLIGTLDRPTEGRVLLSGRDVADLTERQLAELRSEAIGLVFQLHHLLPQCTVLENVLIPSLAKGSVGRTEPVESRARRLLQRVGLTERLERRPGQLSGGERQRVAVVRALINEPKLLLADEPTGALDRVSGEKLADLLVELNREEGVAMVVSTHALDLAKRMSRVLELRDGALFPAGSLA